MPDATSQPALTALTEWWEEMGVETDEALVSACLTAAEQARTASEAPVATPVPARRKRHLSVED